MLLLGISAIFLAAACGPSTPDGVKFATTIADGPKNLVIKFINAARDGRLEDIAKLAHSGARAEQRIKAAELVNKHRADLQGNISVSVTIGENNGMLTACLKLERTNKFIKAHVNGSGSLEGIGSREIWTLDWFDIRNTPCIGQR